MEFEQYVIEEALILIPVLLVIGKLLKQSPIADWVIPYVLLVFGVVLSFLLLGFAVASFVQGVLIVGASVFTHQLIKQTNEANQ